MPERVKTFEKNAKKFLLICIDYEFEIWTRRTTTNFEENLFTVEEQKLIRNINHYGYERRKTLSHGWHKGFWGEAILLGHFPIFWSKN